MIQASVSRDTIYRSKELYYDGVATVALRRCNGGCLRSLGSSRSPRMRREMQMGPPMRDGGDAAVPCPDAPTALL